VILHWALRLAWPKHLFVGSAGSEFNCCFMASRADLYIDGISNA
jgi:hypothetical protein